MCQLREVKDKGKDKVYVQKSKQAFWLPWKQEFNWMRMTLYCAVCRNFESKANKKGFFFLKTRQVSEKNVAGVQQQEPTASHLHGS